MENQETIENKPKKVAKKSQIPEAQFELQTVAQNVLEKWKNTPQIILTWVNPADFEALITKFNAFLGEKSNVGSKRATQTHTLGELDKQIDKAVEQVKIAVFGKFGKEKGKAYFAEFGISKQGTNGSYKIPADRSQRLNILPLFVKAVAEHQIKTPEFKAEFFQSIVNEYQTAFNATQSTNSTIATSVGNKNEVMKEIKQVLQSLVLVIKANYPKTYTSELRGWGF
jgi:hypothetical protein